MREDVGMAVVEVFQTDDGGVIKKKLLPKMVSPV